MHSMSRNMDDTYCVGRLELVSDHHIGQRTELVPMFDLLKLQDALALVNVLNGGAGDTDSIMRAVAGKHAGCRG